ncbi:CMP-sialic acid transporter [Lachnellula hyalina]|uniref:CMP-sialic acid transporter n=1 Tax=Lachnellula hyalina TaxID=1316788 RepID=A0A8H8R1R2_9HELO|nr:CMP-sialic acid transporter [Lachnellula hyalina]TVY26165.1 CMP-sialic acid transporter [Lachnellula hyalina]
MTLSTSSLLLIVYVSCETTRANYAYHAFHNFPQISASLIALLSGVLKLAIAIIFLLRSDNGITISSFHKFIQTVQQGQSDFRRMLRYAIPAALYLINNLIYYTVLPKTSPGLLQVCVLAKLPTTGILHHYMIKPQKNVHAWISLLFLCIGLVIFNVPSKTDEHKSIAEAGSAWYLAPLAGFAIACFSALASISAETSTKTGDFWESQAYLYVWGIVFAIIAYPLIPSSGTEPGERSQGSVLSGEGMSIIGLVVITSGMGLVVAVVLRARDNILKMIGTAASLVTVSASQYILFPELRSSTFTTWRVCGGGIVVISTWCYNHYSQIPWPPKDSKEFADEQVPETEFLLIEESSSQEKEAITNDLTAETSTKGDLLQPDSTKILACAIVIAFATMEVALSKS